MLRQAAVAVAMRVLTLHCLWNVNTRWLGQSIKVPTSPHRYHLRIFEMFEKWNTSHNQVVVGEDKYESHIIYIYYYTLFFKDDFLCGLIFLARQGTSRRKTRQTRQAVAYVFSFTSQVARVAPELGKSLRLCVGFRKGQRHLENIATGKQTYYAAFRSNDNVFTVL